MLGAATVACDDGGTGSAPRPSAAASEPRATPGDATGYRGAVAVGLDDELRPRAGPGRTFVITTHFQLGPSSCGGASGAACPARKDAAVDFSISALLDYREAVDVSPGAHLLTATSPETLEAQVRLPRLAEGRHCILVVVAEDPLVVVRDELPSHGTALLYDLQAGSSDADHCEARQGRGAAPDLAPDLQGGCADPVLSTKERDVYLDRAVAPAFPLWLFAPPCDDERLVALVIDGALAGANESYSPLTVPALERSMMIDLGTMWSESVQAVVARRPAKGGAEPAALSQPVATVP